MTALAELIRLMAVDEGLRLHDYELINKDDHNFVSLLVELRAITKVESNARMKICYEEQFKVCEIAQRCVKDKLLTDWYVDDAKARNGILMAEKGLRGELTNLFHVSLSEALRKFTIRTTNELMEELLGARIPTDVDWYTGLRRILRRAGHDGAVAKDKELTRKQNEREVIDSEYDTGRVLIIQEWEASLQRKVDRVPKVAHKYLVKGIERLYVNERSTRESLTFQIGCDMRYLRSMCALEASEIQHKERIGKIIKVQSVCRVWLTRRRYYVILPETVERRRLQTKGLDTLIRLITKCANDAASTAYMRELEAQWCSGFMLGPVPTAYLGRQRERVLYCFRMEQEAREQILREWERYVAYANYFALSPYLQDIEAEESIQRHMLTQWHEHDAREEIVHVSAQGHKEKMYGGMFRRDLFEAEGYGRRDIWHDEDMTWSLVMGDHQRWVANWEWDDRERKRAKRAEVGPVPSAVHVAFHANSNSDEVRRMANLEYTESLLRVRQATEEECARRILDECVLDLNARSRVVLEGQYQAKQSTSRAEEEFRSALEKVEEQARDELWILHTEERLFARYSYRSSR